MGNISFSFRNEEMEAGGEEFLWLVSGRLLDHLGFVVFVVACVVHLIEVICKDHTANENLPPGDR